MAIVASDIKFYLSGGASNADPNASLGGAKSSTEWAGGTLHDLFDKITGPENTASDVEYRCVYVENTHVTLTLEATKVFVQSQVSGGAAIAIALAGEGVDGTAETIANEGTAPAGESFSTPTDYAGGLSIGDLEAGEHHAIWIRRTAANSSALDDDGGVLRVQGDTAE